MRSLPAALLTFALVAAPLEAAVAAPAADDGPPPISREQTLSADEWHRIFPAAPDPIDGSLRSTMYAPGASTCSSFAVPVRGVGDSLQTFFAPNAQRNGLLGADQEVVRLRTKKAAARVVGRFRAYVRECVGDEHTDDGEGGALFVRTRAWDVPRLAGGSTGYLEGETSYGATSWERVVVVRVRRLVSVISVTFDTRRPSEKSVVRAARTAVTLLR